MATYAELLGIAAGGDGDALKNKIKVAVVVAAEAIRNELDTVDNHANRLAWSKEAFANPGAKAQEMLWALLAQNKDATVATITSASDTAVQTNVDAAVDVFATG